MSSAFLRTSFCRAGCQTRRVRSAPVTRAFVVVVSAVFAACAKTPAPPAQLVPLPPLASAPPTARERSLQPAHAPSGGGANPALPENLPAYLDDDEGALAEGPGDDVVVRTVDGSDAPPPGPNAHRLVRFVHLADIQLMDDESPARAADFDSPSVSSAIRPQDPLICRMLNAAVRSVNALDAEDPVDFLLLGGDNSDSAQENEVRWVMQILDGAGRVECDSGADDDIDPGADDGKDPFAAAGLDVPWFWVNGNHDVTVQGTFAIDDTQRAIAVGSEAQFGTRDYSGGGLGVVVDGGGIIADPQRRLLDGPALLDFVGGDGDGHGLKALAASDAGARGKAFYSFDVPGAPITFMVLDTTHARGGGEGVLQRADVERFVLPVLDDAQARGRVVVLASHHAVSSLTADGGTFGVAEDDALLGDDWRAVLAAYPNVLFSMVGHAHRNRIMLQQAVDPASGDPGHAFWEVMTSALADFPHQFRIVEIWDDDNGTLRLSTSPVDFAADDDPPAALGRALGVVDFLTGWQPNDGRGDAGDRSVDLIVPVPPGVTL